MGSPAGTATAAPRCGGRTRRAWWLYLRIHLGAFPFGQGSQRLTAPFAGWERALVDAASQSWSAAVDTSQLGQAAVPLIIVVGLAILIGAIRAVRLRGVVDPAFLVARRAVRLRKHRTAFQYPKDLIRELALVLLLLPFVFAARSSAEALP